MLRVVDHEGAPQERRDDKRWNASPRAPEIVRAGLATLAGRGDVVPLAAELVVGHHHHRVLATGAAFDRPQKLDQVVAARALARVTRMFVVLSDGLDKADPIQVALSVG